MSSPSKDTVDFLHENMNEPFANRGATLFCDEWAVGRQAQTIILVSDAPPTDLKDLYEEVRIQILTRGKKNEAAYKVYDKIKAIRDFLLSQPDDFQMNGSGYKGFEAVTNIVPLGRDNNERFVYSTNLSTFRKGL